MGSRKYVFTEARKAAFRKAQEKAWAMRRGQGLKSELEAFKKKVEKMSPEEIMKKAVEATKKEQLRIRPPSGSGSMRARQIAQRKMWEGSNYYGPNW